jgi:hypothetical protein
LEKSSVKRAPRVLAASAWPEVISGFGRELP